jgi:hypothetical protein
MMGWGAGGGAMHWLHNGIAASGLWQLAHVESQAGLRGPLVDGHNPTLALSREGDPDSAMHQVASSNLWSKRSQARVLPASDRVTGDPLFLKESSS